jgi:hypothetical protein
MSQTSLLLSDAQRDLLVRILQHAMKEKRVEVRRTEFSGDFRKELEAEEHTIHTLLCQLDPAATTV